MSVAARRTSLRLPLFVGLFGLALAGPLAAQDDHPILEKVRAETEKSLKEADEQLSHEAKRARQEIQATTPALAKQIATKLLQREVR